MLGSSLCEYMGLQPRMCTSMVAGGASPGIMLRHAAQAIASGTAETVLVCAGENRATGLGREAAIAVLTNVGHPQFEKPYGGSIPGFYAMVARRHMHEYGTTREQLASGRREHARARAAASERADEDAADGRAGAGVQADRRSAAHARLLHHLGRRRRLRRHVGGAGARPEAEAGLPARHRRDAHARTPDVRARPDAVRRRASPAARPMRWRG